jgi:hypothetical protein
VIETLFLREPADQPLSHAVPVAWRVQNDRFSLSLVELDFEALAPWCRLIVEEAHRVPESELVLNSAEDWLVSIPSSEHYATHVMIGGIEMDLQLSLDKFSKFGLGKVMGA